MIIHEQKMEVLMELPQGRDALRGIRWLENNRDQFQGQVYPPIMLQIKIEDDSYAIFFENVIAIRDLVAFAASNPDDMNALLYEFKQNQSLKVNAVTVDPNGNPDHSFPTPNQNFPPEFGFVGYLRDMFTAPAPIKHYLCQVYRLHRIPVFNNKAEKHLQQLVDRYKLTGVFFVGHQRYSGNKSAASNPVRGKNILMVSVDENNNMT